MLGKTVYNAVNAWVNKETRKGNEVENKFIFQLYWKKYKLNSKTKLKCPKSCFFI